MWMGRARNQSCTVCGRNARHAGACDSRPLQRAAGSFFDSVGDNRPRTRSDGRGALRRQPTWRWSAPTPSWSPGWSSAEQTAPNNGARGVAGALRCDKRPASSGPSALAGGHPIRFAGSIDANPLTACQNSRADSETTTDSLLAVFERDVLLATGRAIRIRPARPTDIERLRTFYDALAPVSRHLRFFGGRPFIPHDELERTTVNDVYRHVALFAEFEDQIVGVGEYFASTAGEEAEVAFAVADAHHHEGIATVLLEDLAMVAKAAGFHRLVALTLPENAAMQEVFRTVGLAYRSWLDDGAVRVQLDLTADDLLQDDADHRDWQAVVRSLRSLVEPEHVVIIGAGRDETSAGRRILGHLLESFKGQVSVVHPTAVAVGGVDTVGRLDQLDTVPDLAIIAVPAESVVAVVEQCGAFGVPTAVIISAGFAEVGAGGWRLQDDVLAAARRHGMRIVGPNCLGVVATSCGLNATFTSRVFRPGGIAIASQSGGVGIAIAAEAERRAAGISSFVSMGNKADVSGNDLLRLWAGDESTNVVLLYLESFGDPVRFARVARAVSRRKPIVALKSGRSAPEDAAPSRTPLPSPATRQRSTPCSPTPACCVRTRWKS